MEIVEFKNSLSKVCKVADLSKSIIDQIKSKNINLNDLRFDLELTTYICNVIENEIMSTEKDEKIKIIVNIINQLYTLSDADKSIIESQIEYLLNNKKIKKIKTSKWVWKSTKNWFIKKFA